MRKKDDFNCSFTMCGWVLLIVFFFCLVTHTQNRKMCIKCCVQKIHIPYIYMFAFSPREHEVAFAFAVVVLFNCTFCWSDFRHVYTYRRVKSEAQF